MSENDESSSTSGGSTRDGVAGIQSDAARGIPADPAATSGGYREVYSEERARTADEELQRLAERADTPMIASEGPPPSAGSVPADPDGDPAALRASRDQLREELAVRDGHVRSLREQVRQLEDRIDGARLSGEQVDHFRNENRRLERDAEKARMLGEAREVERSELGARLRSSEAEVTQLRRQIETLESAESTFDSERTGLRHQIRQLEADLVRAARDHESRRSALEVADQDRAELVRTVAALKGDRADDLARVNEVEGLIERRDNEIRHMKKLMDRVVADLERSADATSALEVRTAERDKLRRRVDALEAEVTAQSTEAGASRKALELLASRTTERDLLERQVIDLERALNEANEAKSGSAEAVRTLEVRTRERDSLERRVVSLESELARERAQNAEWGGTADLVASTTAERDRLQRRVSVLESELEAVLSGRDPAPMSRSISTPPVPAPPASLPTTTPDSSVLARLAALESQLTVADQTTPTVASGPPPGFESSAFSDLLPMGLSVLGETEKHDAVPGFSAEKTSEPTSDADAIASIEDQRAELPEQAASHGFQDLVLGPDDESGSRHFGADDTPLEPVRPGIQSMYEQALAESAPVGAEPGPEPARDQGNEALADALFSRSAPSSVPGVETVTDPADDAPAPVREPVPVAQFTPEPRPAPLTAPTQAVAPAAAVPALANRRTFGTRAQTEAEIANGSLVIIDGDGVLNQTRYPERFIDAINQFATGRNLEVQLVFDGARLQPNPQLGSRDRVQVRFTQGVTVPEVISRMLDAVEPDSGTVVASNSADLASAMRRGDGTLISTEHLISAVVS